MLKDFIKTFYFFHDYFPDSIVECKYEKPAKALKRLVLIKISGRNKI